MVSVKTNTAITVTGTKPDKCSINIYFTRENEGKQSNITMVSFVERK